MMIACWRMPSKLSFNLIEEEAEENRVIEDEVVELISKNLCEIIMIMKRNIRNVLLI